MQKTYYPKKIDLEQQDWVLVDAKGQNLGRVATNIAILLLGKLKPTFTPGVECGDHVVVINADHIEVTGNKLEAKMYYRHSGYPGGFREVKLADMLKKHPERVIQRAVWGMLPHNRFGRRLLKKVKVYAGDEHPHEAQQPHPFNF